MSRRRPDSAILGAEPTLTFAEVVKLGRAEPAAARRLWRALGFPDPGDAVAFTPADADALALITTLVERGDLDAEAATKLTRALGHTMARLADWQVSTLSGYVERLAGAGPGTGSWVDSGRAVVLGVAEPVERLLAYTWRRHLAAAVDRMDALGAADADLHTGQGTVGFADLVSFTRLSAGIDEGSLADLVEEFESACADLVARRGGRLIKAIGDSVLFLTDDPVAGVDIASDILERYRGSAERPAVHVGIATGPVVTRLGDVFGNPVNLASRLTGVARRNRVICDAVTAAALRGVAGYDVRPLAERVVRGVGVVQPFTARRRPAKTG
ncbi:MAG TPA: adenylate/guanylate cyclase domain-containing protein [Nocardioidaceae bacterium]|nr:adenylate/guanylate cyclase domain-containing protein [Nocardioidaceae bacterium]